MTIHQRLAIFVFLFCITQGFAQQLSAGIDSIKIYHLPLTMNTFLALDDYEVRNFEGEIMDISILKTHTVTDSAEIRTFSKIDILDTANRLNLRFPPDARVVIDIYLEIGDPFSIVMDGMGFYIVGDKRSPNYRNRNLNDWLRKYIPDLR